MLQLSADQRPIAVIEDAATICRRGTLRPAARESALWIAPPHELLQPLGVESHIQGPAHRATLFVDPADPADATLALINRGFETDYVARGQKAVLVL